MADKFILKEVNFMLVAVAISMILGIKCVARHRYRRKLDSHRYVAGNTCMIRSIVYAVMDV